MDRHGKVGATTFLGFGFVAPFVGTRRLGQCVLSRPCRRCNGWEIVGDRTLCWSLRLVEKIRNWINSKSCVADLCCFFFFRSFLNISYLLKASESETGCPGPCEEHGTFPTGDCHHEGQSFVFLLRDVLCCLFSQLISVSVRIVGRRIVVIFFSHIGRSWTIPTSSNSLRPSKIVWSPTDSCVNSTKTKEVWLSFRLRQTKIADLKDELCVLKSLKHVSRY